MIYTLPFAFLLLTLGVGTFLLTHSCKNETCCRGFAKYVAYFIIGASIIGMALTVYHRSCHKHGNWYSWKCPFQHEHLHDGAPLEPTPPAP